MSLAKRIIFKLYKELVIFKITIGRLFWGIDYVSRKVSLCTPYLIPDMLRRNGALIGENVRFKNALQIDNASSDIDSTGNFSNLIIKDRCYIGKGVFFDLPAKVIIQKECVVSAGVKFITHQDCGDRLMAKFYPRKVDDINIVEGTWIGANAVILHGVNIGKMCVVGAGSVVTKDVPDFCVVVGSPARIVKKIKDV